MPTARRSSRAALAGACVMSILATAADASAASPLRAVVLIDKSGSNDTSGIQPLTGAALDTLTSALLLGGGEIAIGLIRADSKAVSLLRVAVPAPPQAPPEPALPKNAFARAAAERKLAPVRAAAAAARAEWQAGVDHDLAAFREAADQMIAAPAKDRRTDIRGAVVRANLFLSEPISTSIQPPKRFAVFLTDGKHTAGRWTQPEWTAKDATVLLVNGEPDAATLAFLNPKRFESPAAAFAFIRGEMR